MAKTNSVLLIEDDPSLAESLEVVLGEEGYQVIRESRGDLGLQRARKHAFDTVLCDVRLPGLGGLELVRALHAEKPRLPIILMTAHGTSDTAIEAMKFGAFDYLLKPFEMPDLLDLLRRAIASSRSMEEPVELGMPAEGRTTLIGQSRAIQTVFKDIGRLAARPVSVLIRGETGTGKELVARAIYQHSERAEKAFVAINCAAIPEPLLESELFGHERGAFTGAEMRRIGRFEQANGGTVFLDEIGDTSLGTQAKLLRVLQEKTIQRLGGKETIPVDVRVIAATHRDLERAIQAGKFREDLFYRLNVAAIVIPPLRERLEDIPTLASYFLHRYGPEMGCPEPALMPEALALLQQHSWPGNVRELENVIRKALLLTQGFPVTCNHLRPLLSAARRENAAPDESPVSLAQTVAQMLAAAQRGEQTDLREKLLTAVDRELFTQAIRRAQGNQAKAARWLGVSRLTMREKLTQFGIPTGREEDKPTTR